MKKIIIILGILPALNPGYFTLAQQKAVFIIIDGVCADVLESTPTPAIDDIAAAGGYTRAYTGGIRNTYTESPTISSPGYNHLLTGTWSYKHNVWDNSIQEPDYYYRNIFRVVENADPQLRTAIFSTWLDNRTKLIGEGLKEAGAIMLDYSFDGFEMDTVQFPHSNPRYIFDIDEHVSKEAARYILENGPDLSWVYLEYTDDIGHRFGDGPEMIQAVKAADIQIGRIWNSVRERMDRYGEEWMILVTTDHGRKPTNGRDHGGQTDRERTIWIATNAVDLNDHFRQNPSAVDIMPSVLRFMHIGIPEPVISELDGIPFIGRISFSDMKAEKAEGHKIRLTWSVQNPEGRAEILVAYTNNFKEGGEDRYVRMGEVDVGDGFYEMEVPDGGEKFIKILVKGPYNWMNRWVLK